MPIHSSSRYSIQILKNCHRNALEGSYILPSYYASLMPFNLEQLLVYLTLMTLKLQDHRLGI